MKTAFCLVLGLIMVLHSPPACLAQASAPVTLTIEEWADMSPTLSSWDIVMNTVTPDYFCKDWETFGDMLLDVEANTDVTLRCPKLAILQDGTTYDLEAVIALLGINLAYQDDDYWYIDFQPGTYIGETTLKVSLKKHWWVDDLAGIYTGEVLLELVPTP